MLEGKLNTRQNQFLHTDHILYIGRIQWETWLLKFSTINCWIVSIQPDPAHVIFATFIQNFVKKWVLRKIYGVSKKNFLSKSPTEHYEKDPSIGFHVYFIFLKLVFFTEFCLYYMSHILLFSLTHKNLPKD